MSAQLSLDGETDRASERVGHVRVEMLAYSLLGYVRPGYGGAARVPPKVLAEAKRVAKRALDDLGAVVDELERR